MARRSIGTRHGLVLPEVAVVAAILIVAAALLAVLAQRTRQSAGLNQSLANLRQISAWGGSYAADHQERVMGFSWLSAESGGNENLSSFPDLRNFSNDTDGAMCQAIDILRRRSARTGMQRITYWFPFIGYWHLPLVDYLGGSLPAMTFVAPGDVPQLRWARDPEAFWLGQLQPQPDATAWNDRWPFFSSYSMMPAFVLSDGRTGERRPGFRQGGDHNQYATMWAGEITYRRHDQVAFPSAKVLLAEQYQRYYGKADNYYLYPEARVPQLLADGSTTTRPTSEANQGWQNRYPTDPTPVYIWYSPKIWEPALISGQEFSFFGHYRWTRGGLQGRDYNGPEINTSTW